MPLLTVCLILIVIGVLLWLATTYIPLEPRIKQILVAVVVIAVVLWRLNVFGLIAPLSAVRVGK
jgi:hypothetical protein